ncbi:DUF6153 family protein [Actinoplanes utahensis]|uniref:DUF6153 family protein n=1 Tax=Actinoplanes utahensis TaxID=1869 RepID=UPI00195123E8|nr:DUF6153 family protein [Actinoplanes utahensis]
MNQSPAIAVGRTARTVVLLATALGLALMHTLGHTGVRADVHQAMAGMASQVSGTGAMQVMVSAADPCQGGHCDGHGGHGSGLWSACLAILAGLAVAVLLLVLAAAIARRQPMPSPGALRVRSPRAPPDRPTGLTLASTAVLRI